MAEIAPAQAAIPATGAPAAPTNGVTTGTSNAPSDQNAANRGLPYYEKLRRELRDTIQKKRLMDKSMVSRVACHVTPTTEWSQDHQWKFNGRIGSEAHHAIDMTSRLRMLHMLTLDTARPNSKTRSSSSSKPTSKKRRPATSSKASTTTSRAPQAAPVSVPPG